MATQYQYSPLAAQSTRLVIVMADPSTAPIRCRFHVQQVQSRPDGPLRPLLDKVRKVLSKSPVKYEALSYVWGPESQPAEAIFCDGQSLNITANLAEAIRRLRLSDRPRTLWIDQICINQQDTAERSKQLLLMGDIYRNADSVISWLGQDPEAYALTAKRFLHDIADGRFKDVGSRFAPGLEGFLSDHGLPETGAPEWESINALLGLAYFTRVWILQEVMLARQLTFLWGHTQIPWHLFTDLISWMIKNLSLFHNTHAPLDETKVSKLFAFHDLQPEKPRTLEQCLLKVCRRECKIEVDRIYSVLGLVGDGPTIVPDYALPAAKVFRDVTLATCALRKKLDILSDVHHWEEDALRPAEWPTWVPRWNRPTPTKVLRNGPFAVSGRMDFVPPRLSRAEFRVELRGIVLDVESVARNDILAFHTKDQGITVEAGIQHIWGAWTDLTRDAAALQRNTDLMHDFLWTLLCGEPEKGLWNGKAWSENQIYQDFAAYWAERLLGHVLEGIPDVIKFVASRTSIAGMAALRYRRGRESTLADCGDRENWESLLFDEHENPREFKQDLAELKPIISDVLLPYYGKLTAEAVTDALACFYPDSDYSKFRQSWESTGITSSFFILRDGYIGMGPHIMRDTDVVAVFAGSSVPYVLRPTEGGYMLLGDCYVHRIMQGELVHELASKGALEWTMRTITLC